MESRAVAKIKGDNIIVYWNRTTLSLNGTLELHEPHKGDSGAFRLEGYGGNGKCVFSGNVQLEVQDPVSQPVVSLVSCDSGRAVLRCEVERGDTVSFWWGVRGGSVNTSLEVIAEGGPVLSVESSISGELVCMANNSVSAETSAPLKPTCHVLSLCSMAVWGTRQLTALLFFSLHHFGQHPVSQPVVSLVSCDSGRAVLRCEVERGDTVSFWWGVRGGSVNTSLEVIAEPGPVLFVESSISGELLCMANNSVSAETSAPLKPTCPVLAGIAPASLRRNAATLALARKAQKYDWHILHKATTTPAPPCRLKSRHPYKKAAQEMLQSIPEDLSRDAWLAASWKQTWETAGPSRILRYIRDPGDGDGMGQQQRNITLNIKARAEQSNRGVGMSRTAMTGIETLILS
ncbi:hypothetical protein AAFF_G00319320 [Aldrovandia affinis]|uniref:Ig-like domain-containing protein n=1 Tax=Aldrovandia affinis TaxID=143900 RepID=A0AAD7SML1_9TELE|nr:hypothetical protein AAFF_G00319320 [Aldrovandia affinis]